MLKHLIITFIFTLTLNARGQILGAKDQDNFHKIKSSQSNSAESNLTSSLIDDSIKVSELLNKRLKHLAGIDTSLTKESCESSGSYELTLALYMKGDFLNCSNFVKNCLSKNKILDQKTYIQGARCAFEDYDYKSTKKIFSAAIKQKNFKKETALPTITEFATSAMAGIFPQEVKQIISMNPYWSEKEKELAYSLIEILVKGKAQRNTNLEVVKFIKNQESKSNAYKNQYIKALLTKILISEYRIEDAYKYFMEIYTSLENPFDWIKSAYSVFYAMVKDANFIAPKNIYDSYSNFTHPRSSLLPKEHNTLNYTQISTVYCSKTFMPSKIKDTVNSLLIDWKSNHISTQQLADKLINPISNFNIYSDVQSILGSLYSILGNDEMAKNAYWNAHKLCPYNNRAHWGLTTLERKLKYKSFPEYNDNETLLHKIVDKLSIPQEINSYIPNFNSFPSESKKRIIYAARIWLPFMKILLNEENKAIIKIPFEKLSDIEGMDNLKDSRIGPPDLPDYLYDNRLWDDVRGVGGQIVAADHDEVFQTVQGDYNLLGHEISHQFHHFLESRNPQVYECIKTLYEQAKERNVFADPYAKSNEFEYFAQGITYYLVHENAPPRYGLNKSWIKTNDPNLNSLLENIEKSNGDIENLKCSI